MSAADVTEPTWPACIDCNEPDSGSCPGGRCRDCDVEHVVDGGRCRECGKWIKNEQIFGPAAAQHVGGCSLANAYDWRPLPTRTDVWKARYSQLIDLAWDYEREAVVLPADDLRAGVLRAVVVDLRRRAAEQRAGGEAYEAGARQHGGTTGCGGGLATGEAERAEE